MLSEEVKKLEEDYSKAIDRIKYLEKEVSVRDAWMKTASNAMKMIEPTKIYTHKQRRNTTVKFKDGSQQTVKRRPGEKDCVETALAYAVLKQLLTSQELKKLIAEREEH